MKIEAYRCDYCKFIHEAAETIGVSSSEDLFSKTKSYPSNPDPKKESIHYCLDCYTKFVTMPARVMFDRSKHEEQYKLKIEELGYLLRRNTVFAALNRNKGK